MRQMFLAAGVFSVVLIITLSLVPGSLRPQTGTGASFEHFMAYALTASVLTLHRASNRWRIGVVVGLLLLAGLLEGLQFYVPGRHAQVTGALISGLGALAGGVASALILPGGRRKSK